MIYILDIGNTRYKLAASSTHQPADLTLIQTGPTASLPGQLHTVQFQPGATLAWATTAGDRFALHLQEIAAAHALHLTRIQPRLPDHIPSHYAPGQAGVDRLANVIAAIHHGQLPAIIFDAGSALTMEVISHEGHFLGGAILPGYQLQAQSLNRGTADLPHLQQSNLPLLTTPIATNTHDAITAGITYGLAGAIQNLHAHATRQLTQSPHTILTGGDAPQIQKLLPKLTTTLDPLLTLKGLLLLTQSK